MIVPMLISAVLWITGVVLFNLKKDRFRIAAHVCITAGIASLILYLGYLWVHLQRPPLKTNGELRIWFALIFVMTGYNNFLRYKSLIFLKASLILSLFLFWFNIKNPELIDKSIVPALRNGWFYAHMLFYLAGFTVLCFSGIIASVGLFMHQKKELLNIADGHVYAGFTILTLGLVAGVVWNIEIEGVYLSFGKKEIWTIILWLIYLAYLHYSIFRIELVKIRLGILALILMLLIFLCA